MAIRILTWRQYSTKIEFFTAFYVNFNSADGFKHPFSEFKQLQSAVEECDVVHLGLVSVCRRSHMDVGRFAYKMIRLQVDSPTLSCF